MIGRILVALDTSPRAPGVFQVAAEVARRFNAKVWLVRVVTIPPEIPPSAHVNHGDPLPRRLEDEAVEELRQYLENNPDVELEAPVVTFGAQPWRQILEQADAVEADLIVIGSHGYHGLDRLIGTTAGAIANRSRRNVLVVHDRSNLPASEH